MSIFRGGLLRKRRMTLFREGCSFYIKNKLKSEIFNGKKVNLIFFFSVVTKNLNWVILTFSYYFRIQLLLKDGIGLRIKCYRGGLAKTRGRLGQFADLRGGLAKKRGEVFLRDGIDTPMHSMLVLVLKLQFEKNSKFDSVFSKSAVFYGTFSNRNMSK